MREPVFLALDRVGRYVVQLAEFGGEGDVPGIVKAGVWELEDAVLCVACSAVRTTK